MLTAGVLLAALYVVLPYGPVASVLYVVASLAAAAAVGWSARRRAYQANAWRLVAASYALAATGHAVWYVLDLLGRDPFPSLADVFYLGVYPLLAVALWRLGGARRPGDGVLTDTLIVGVSTGVVAWAVLIAPFVADPALTEVELVVSAAYPVADVVLLSLVLRLGFRHHAGGNGVHLLLLGVLAYLAADVLYAHGNATGWYAPGGVTDGLWLISYTFVVAAAWHPTTPHEPASATTDPLLTGRRVAVLGAASVLAPSVILTTGARDVEVVRVAAVASILLFLLILHRMAALVRHIHSQAAVLEEQSRTDPLTGAANRRHLQHELAREFARLERRGGELAVAYLDLDHFKRFNDTHGHTAGDELLRDLVARWQGQLRPIDVLARVGGEEFVVVFPDIDLGSCRMAVERLRLLVPDHETCSAGIAVYHEGDDVDDLVSRADEALYAAKRVGRDRTVVHDPATPTPRR